jgi:hypothetical protein
LEVTEGVESKTPVLAAAQHVVHHLKIQSYHEEDRLILQGKSLQVSCS